MNSIAHIRQNIFKIPQASFAAIAETTQATVSRWENGELRPDQHEMTLIRAAAKEQGIAWDDSWFFETPEPAPCRA